MDSKGSKTKKLSLGLALCLLVAPAVATAGSDYASAKKDIVETAIAAGQFHTLVEAVKAAGLVEVLKGDGPFTVFAPTDEAFSKLPAGTLESLLGDPKALAEVLTYHVVPGKVMAADVANLDSAETVQGQRVRFDASSGVKVNGANVISADVIARNGVIHVIDAVILPD